MQERAAERMSILSAVLAWFTIGLVEVVGSSADRGASRPLWWAVYLAYGAAYLWVVLAPQDGDRHRPREVWITLALVVPLGLSIVLLSGSVGFTTISVVMSAVLLAQLLPWRLALVGILAQTAALMAGIGAQTSTLDGLAYAVSTGAAFLAFQVFVLIMVIALRSADAARTEADQARAQAEAATAALQEAQAQLAATSRSAERLRIARDLHDVVGHQLTALSVNLQVASRTAVGDSRDQIEVCRAVASDLLRDVREVVSQLREGRADVQAAALAEELRRIGASVPAPVVHVQVDAELPPLAAQEADVVRRCVQEVVTNAARHSGAASLWIAVEELDGIVSVTARDDGRGVAADGGAAAAGTAGGTAAGTADGSGVAPGHGLTGMVERFEALGGSVAWAAHPGQGFSVQASLPVGGASSGRGDPG